MISIVVPVYNVEKYIRRCIESIIAQTYNDWELLLVDDGSPDNSGAICDEYSQIDKRIKAFHKKNGGVGSARNYGIDKALGERILFIDSDDWIDSSYIENFLKYNDDERTFIIQGRYNDYIDGTQPQPVVFEEAIYNKSNIVKAIKDSGLLFHGAPYCKLYNRFIIQDNNIRFPEHYSYGEDTLFFLNYLQHIEHLRIESNIGYHYIHYVGENLSYKLHKTEALLDFMDESCSIICCLDDNNQTLRKEYSYSCVVLLKKAIISLCLFPRKKAERIIVLKRIQKMCRNEVHYLKGVQIKDKFVIIFTCYSPIRFVDFVFLHLIK